MLQQANRIRGIIFDLDGTLYVSPDFAATIQDAAAGYIAGLRGITPEQAGRLMAATRSLLTEETGGSRPFRRFARGWEETCGICTPFLKGACGLKPT